jgi:hypothetical protein
MDDADVKKLSGGFSVTPATGDHRNHIPKDYDEAAELHQVGGAGYCPLAGSNLKGHIERPAIRAAGLLILAHSFYLERLSNALL